MTQFLTLAMSAFAAILAEPVSATVFDVIFDKPDLKTLWQLVNDLEDADMPLLETLDNPNATLTVFAPSNDAFAALDNATSAYLQGNTSALYEVLTYHVLGSVVLSSGIPDHLTAEPILEGQDVEVVKNATGAFVNDAKVVTPDLRAQNGVVHIIDTVLILEGFVVPPPGPATVVDVVAGEPNLKMLVNLVTEAGLVNALSASNASLTVFAPTDDAFAALGNATLLWLQGNTENDELTLQELLKNHVLGSEIVSSSFRNETETSLEGGDVEIIKTPTVVFVGQQGTCGPRCHLAKVVTVDLRAQNGVVHIIDAVLIPEDFAVPPAVTATVLDVVAPETTLKTLVQLVTDAGLVDTLSKPYPFMTVFAPTEDAFAALDKATLAYLQANKSALKEVLKYHVLGSDVPSSDIPDHLTAEPTLEGQNVTVIKNSTGAFVNDAKVGIPDLRAGNGVVHIIDAVLIPKGFAISPPNPNPNPNPSPPPTSAPATSAPSTSASSSHVTAIVVVAVVAILLIAGIAAVYALRKGMFGPRRNEYNDASEEMSELN